MISHESFAQMSYFHHHVYDNGSDFCHVQSNANTYSSTSSLNYHFYLFSFLSYFARPSTSPLQGTWISHDFNFSWNRQRDLFFSVSQPPKKTQWKTVDRRLENKSVPCWGAWTHFLLALFLQTNTSHFDTTKRPELSSFDVTFVAERILTSQIKLENLKLSYFNASLLAISHSNSSWWFC